MPVTKVEFNPKDPKHINSVINKLIADIDNVLRFKLKNYFENFYLLLVERLGVKEAGANWAAFLEYGTSDYKIIELQNIGIPRHLAIFILNEHSDCLTFEEQSLVKIDYIKLLDDVDSTSDEYMELKEIFEYEFKDPN